MRLQLWCRRVGISIVLLAAMVAAQACAGSGSGGPSPTAPSASPVVGMTAGPALSATAGTAYGDLVDAATSAFVAGAIPVSAGTVKQVVSRAADVVFPPRSEPLLFRTALEAKYRDGLRRSPVPTYVDQEGTVVWVQEYLRYRVNLCSHAEAVLRVFRQIDGQGVQPTCGTASTATFPPRQEPVDFMVQLEAKYRDGLRRSAGTSSVDVEGNVIWTQEYLRYRVAACGHSEAQQKVFDQVDGRGVASDCLPPPMTFTFIARACACVNGSIEIRLNSQIVGLMGCSETRTFTVPRGTYTVSACGSNGCFGGNTLGTFSSSTTRQLIC